MCGPKDELTAVPAPAYEPLGAQYDIVRTIGQGSYAQVKLANHRLTGTAVAIKVLPKEKLHYYLISTEVGIMKRMNHPNIVSLHQIIETEKNVFLILELVDGYELLDWIEESGFLPEGLARKIFRQIVHAMCYCHDIGVVHHDLKPDNIMVDSTGNVKIVDFGLGALVEPGMKLSRFCGALQFSAPEYFLQQPYDGTKVDTWNLGVILYFMVTGVLPFEGATYKELESQILLGQYAIPHHLSKELQEIIRLLLTVNPTERPALKDIMAHPWLKKEEPSSSSHSDKMDPSHLDPEIMTVMADMGFDPQEGGSAPRRRLGTAGSASARLRGGRLQADQSSKQRRIARGLLRDRSRSAPQDPGFFSAVNRGGQALSWAPADQSPAAEPPAGIAAPRGGDADSAGQPGERAGAAACGNPLNLVAAEAAEMLVRAARPIASSTFSGYRYVLVGDTGFPGLGGYRLNR
uniref:sperm motility kinase 3A-like n=1 Tax=Arvicanthis niloticus TaxID=61156 RepID=UPI001486E0DB|nr:sperm motility kinase 3A-like [Arvicanthis niloticus]